jgi:putative heme iron utilization protein
MNGGSQSPFVPAVIEAIARHMNDDHAEDSLLICRMLGGQPAAERAMMTGMDEAGIVFTAEVGGEAVAVRIPWSQPVTERAQVRSEVVRMHERAVALTTHGTR